MFDKDMMRRVFDQNTTQPPHEQRLSREAYERAILARATELRRERVIAGLLPPPLHTPRSAHLRGLTLLLERMRGEAPAASAAAAGDLWSNLTPNEPPPGMPSW